jgi:hypothetical protein
MDADGSGGGQSGVGYRDGEGYKKMVSKLLAI